MTPSPSTCRPSSRRSAPPRKRSQVPRRTPRTFPGTSRRWPTFRRRPSCGRSRHCHPPSSPISTTTSRSTGAVAPCSRPSRPRWRRPRPPPPRTSSWRMCGSPTSSSTAPRRPGADLPGAAVDVEPEIVCVDCGGAASCSAIRSLMRASRPATSWRTGAWTASTAGTSWCPTCPKNRGRHPTPHVDHWYRTRGWRLVRIQETLWT